jgi:hypothetical protein
MPITIEMNITEKSDRWPMASVVNPIDQQRPITRSAHMSVGLPTRLKPQKIRAIVSANDRMLAHSLSWSADTISSFESAALPVTPTAMSGNSGRMAATTARTPSIASRSAVKLPAWLRGTARMNSSRSSSERKYPASLSSVSTEKNAPHGDL